MQMSQVKLCAARARVIYELLQQYPIHTHSLKLGGSHASTCLGQLSGDSPANLPLPPMMQKILPSFNLYSGSTNFGLGPHL